MNTQDLIKKINNSVKIEDVLDITNIKSEFGDIIKEIHPDICTLPGAPEAMQKMNEYREVFNKGRAVKDDAGEYRTNGYWLDFNSKEKNMNWSIENYRLFQQLQEPTDRLFLKYLPKECIIQPDGNYRMNFDKRAIPLSGLTLPQEHVNWVLNRLLEYCAYMQEKGFSHCGLNPESVFIVPETHGIQVVSFYHLTRIGNKIGTISAKYKNWYPNEIFTTKEASPAIDIELSKRIAAYLLGDKSGSGIKFSKTHNEDFINFILTKESDSYKSMVKYRTLLKKNFETKFHSLTV